MPDLQGCLQALRLKSRASCGNSVGGNDRRGTVTASNGAPGFRADHVGSLLRPQRLLNARQRFDVGKIGRDAIWGSE